MNDIVKLVLKEEPEALNESLRSKEALAALKRFSDNVDSALAKLNPLQHTVGCLHLLNAKTKKVNPVFLNTTAEILRSGNADQILLASAEFCSVVEAWFESPAVQNSIHLAVPLLRRACRIFDEALPLTVTPVHAMFLQSCYSSHHFHVARNILQPSRLFVGPPQKFNTSVVHVLRFFYLSGALWCGLKQWGRAVDSFLQCLCIPGEALSVFQVQAYQKATLCSILASGNVLRLPATSSRQEKLLRPQVECYEALGKLMASSQMWAVDQALNHMTRILSDDGNLGLAQQARQSVLRRSLLKLAGNFVTLPLKQLAIQAGLPILETEHLILEIVSRGEIQARINQAEGLVSFLDAEEEQNFNGPQSVQVLHNKLQEIVNLNKAIDQEDRRLRADPLFLSAIAKPQGSSSSSSSSAFGLDDDLRMAIEVSRFEV